MLESYRDSFPITRLATRVMVLLLLSSLQGCKSPSTRGDGSSTDAPAAGQEGVEADALKPEKAVGAAAGDAALTPSEDKERCAGAQADADAETRQKEELLFGLYLSTGRRAVLWDHMQSVSELGSGRDLAGIDDLVDATMKRLVAVEPGAGEMTRRFLETTARVRLAAYGTCRSVTDDDVSWCDAMIEDPDRRIPCLVVNTMYARIMRRVLQGGQDCATAMAGSPEVGGLDEKGWKTVCEAVVARDSSMCPGEADSMWGAMCRGVTDRLGGWVCEELEDKYGATRAGCCEKYAWRFNNARQEGVSIRYSPEKGALSREVAGCDRALVWGLLTDLEPLIGESRPLEDPAVEKLDGDQYLCQYKIDWSTQLLPSETVASVPSDPPGP